jgi:hypothetical protein
VREGEGGGREGWFGGLADVCLIAGGGLPVFVLKEKKKPKRRRNQRDDETKLTKEKKKPKR